MCDLNLNTVASATNTWKIKGVKLKMNEKKICKNKCFYLKS